MIDVKFRVDDVNVDSEDGCGMEYCEDFYYVNSQCKWSVLIDVYTDDMVKVLEDKGYEVKKKMEVK